MKRCAITTYAQFTVKVRITHIWKKRRMRTVVCAHQKLCDIITVVYFAALAVLLAAETEIGQSIATNAAQQIKRTKQKSTMTDFLVYR